MPREWLIQHRAGTLAEWAAAEASGPVLLAGERAYITDLKLDVVGDGVTKVASLGAVGSGTYARPRANTFVALGDSLFALADATGTHGRFAQSLPVSIALLSGGRLHMLKNAGVTGNTAAMALARFDADVTPYAPGIVFTGVGTNDINVGVSLAAFLATIAAIDVKVKSIGAMHVITAIPPNAGVGKRSVLDLWNLSLSRFAATNRALFVDPYGAISDPSTGALATAYNLDGLHVNVLGAGAAGKAIADAVAPLVTPTNWPPLARDNSDAGNLLSNALGLVDANADGVPDYWSASVAAGLTKSLVDPSAGEAALGIRGKWLTLTAASVAAPGSTLQYYQNVRMTNHGTPTLADGRATTVHPGDRVALSCWVKTSGLTGPCSVTAYIYSLPSYSYARVLGLIYPVGTAGKLYLEYSVPNGADNELSIYLALERAVIPNSTNVPGIGGSTVDGVISFAHPTLRNLTVDGLGQMVWP